MVFYEILYLFRNMAGRPASLSGRASSRMNGPEMPIPAQPDRCYDRPVLPEQAGAFISLVRYDRADS